MWCQHAGLDSEMHGESALRATAGATLGAADGAGREAAIGLEAKACKANVHTVVQEGSHLARTSGSLRQLTGWPTMPCMRWGRSSASHELDGVRVRVQQAWQAPAGLHPSPNLLVHPELQGPPSGPCKSKSPCQWNERRHAVVVVVVEVGRGAHWLSRYATS